MRKIEKRPAALDLLVWKEFFVRRKIWENVFGSLTCSEHLTIWNIKILFSKSKCFIIVSLSTSTKELCLFYWRKFFSAISLSRLLIFLQSYRQKPLRINFIRIYHVYVVNPGMKYINAYIVKIIQFLDYMQKLFHQRYLIIFNYIFCSKLTVCNYLKYCVA